MPPELPVPKHDNGSLVPAHPWELLEFSERKRAPANQRARRVETSTQSDAAYEQEGRVEGRAFARGGHLPKEA
jgi:hypothetical protein